MKGFYCIVRDMQVECLVEEGNAHVGIAMVLVIIMATPPAAVLSLFSQLFGKDTELASSVVSVYTLFSVVTMPLMIGLAQYLLY